MDRAAQAMTDMLEAFKESKPPGVSNQALVEALELHGKAQAIAIRLRPPASPDTSGLPVVPVEGVSADR